MANYRNGSHTVYDIKYHFVWITKYRYEVLKGDVAFRLRDLLRQGCDSQGIKILQGNTAGSCTYAIVMSSELGPQ